MKKILVNRTDAIGDTLLTTSLARFIKDLDPDCHISIIVSKRSGDLIRYCSGIDQVFIFDQNASLIHKLKFLLKEVFTQDFDSYAHLGGSFLPSVVALLKGVEVRTGILSKIASYLCLNEGIRQSRSQVLKHEVAYNIDFAPKLLGLENQELSPNTTLVSDYAPVLNLPARDLKLAWLGEYTIIHPGMTGHTLNWPMNNYAELVDKIINEGQKTNVVVSYTPSDLAYIEELKGELSKRSVLDHKRLFFFNGAHDGLVHFAHVMSGANLFVGPSTGTTHMANALKIGQVAIYSPIKVQSAKRWGPAYSWDQCFVLAPDNEKMAMKTITVDTVYLACQKVLNERSCNNE